MSRPVEGGRDPSRHAMGEGPRQRSGIAEACFVAW